MLVEQYDLEVFTPPCEPGAERFSAIARLTVDISEVLPYLNATLKGAVYNLAAGALTWKRDGRSVTFADYQIAASNLEDRDEAVRVIESLIERVNHAWERRAEITPDYEAHQRARPLAVYKLLPGTNCKACGEPTCYTFALKLAASQRRIADCPPLTEPECADKLAALQAIVMDAPTSG
jgi:ArsR family metal-binding transcriptional regulator